MHFRASKIAFTKARLLKHDLLVYSGMREPLACRSASAQNAVACPGLRVSPSKVMTAVRRYGMLLQDASGELRGDREVVMIAVSNKPLALRYASEELRGDREIVMKAVSNKASALEFATAALRGDREIVKKAVSKNGLSLEFATEELRGDPEIIEAALKEVASRHKSSNVVALKVTFLSGPIFRATA